MVGVGGHPRCRFDQAVRGQEELQLRAHRHVDAAAGQVRRQRDRLAGAVGRAGDRHVGSGRVGLAGRDRRGERERHARRRAEFDVSLLAGAVVAGHDVDVGRVAASGIVGDGERQLRRGGRGGLGHRDGREGRGQHEHGQCRETSESVRADGVGGYSHGDAFPEVRFLSVNVSGHPVRCPETLLVRSSGSADWIDIGRGTVRRSQEGSAGCEVDITVVLHVAAGCQRCQAFTCELYVVVVILLAIRSVDCGDRYSSLLDNVGYLPATFTPIPETGLSRMDNPLRRPCSPRIGTLPAVRGQLICAYRRATFRIWSHVAPRLGGRVLS